MLNVSQMMAAGVLVAASRSITKLPLRKAALTGVDA